MAKAAANFRKAATGYLEKTHHPLNCLVFILPLLTAYEVGALFFRNRLLATDHLAQLLKLFGATARFLPAVVIVVVLLAWQILSRKQWHADADALLGMAAESILWMIPLVALHALTWRLFSVPALAAGGGSGQAAVEILTGIGAGVYEEFLFRLGAISLFLLLCVDVLRAPKKPTVAAAVLLTSVLFSLYHFLGAGTFNGYQFAFRAFAGAYLATLYILRGFGITVGAHACYNVFASLA